MQQSGIGTGIQDGLTWNPYAYGLRVQDREISLNVPDVSKLLLFVNQLMKNNQLLILLHSVLQQPSHQTQLLVKIL